MQFIYQQEGADPRSWPFAPGKLMSPEVEEIERQTGMSYKDWVEAVANGSALAIHGFLYVMLKRSSPTLRWGDVQFCMDEIDMQMDDDEIAGLRDHLTKRVADGTATKDEIEVLESLPEVPEAPKAE